MRGYGARESSRSEAYLGVRRNAGSRAVRSRRVFFNSLYVPFFPPYLKSTMR